MTTKQRWLSFFSFVLPRIQDILFMGIFIAVIGLGPHLLNIDGDLGRHIVIGDYILQTGEIPLHDLFSHTMTGEPLTPHEWLSEVVLSFMHQTAGLNGVVWFCALLIGLIFTLVYKHCIDRNGLILISLGFTILAGASSSLHWLARPHLFTMFFVSIWVYGLERIRCCLPYRWWFLPMIMGMWVNFHGAFISGFVILCIYLVGELTDELLSKRETGLDSPKPGFNSSLKRYLVTGVLSFLMTFLNPVGLRIWKTSLGYISNQYLVNHTAEYLPPNFHDPSTWPFLMMILFSLVIFGFNRKRIPVVSQMLLISWMAMSLYSVRNVPLFAIIVAPILTQIFSTEIRSNQTFGKLVKLQDRLKKVDCSLVGSFGPIALILVIGISFLYGANLDFENQGNRFSDKVFPVEAVNWLDENLPSGVMFNYFPWGGYLLFRLWPSEKVFIDGQTDFYGEVLTREYENVITFNYGWDVILDKYEVSWIIMPTDSLLVRFLQKDLRWSVAYEDEIACILIR